ncbi:MAG: transglycosylase SLT domain-containing protein [Muribaculaceae bacterium]|nr:transglycosylase SLT domain-containing protein [Muribaculaceae bacterium]
MKKLGLPILIILTGCVSGKSNYPHDHLTLNVLPDTLRVGTLYSPTSYFQFRDEVMGYDYSLIQQLGKDKNMEVEFSVASSLPSLIELLDSGYIDIIAYDVPVTGEYREKVIPCGYEHLSTQLLVQKKGPNVIKDVTELIGKDIFVEKNSKYLFRLENLDEELGGGINIHEIESDTIITEDLLDRVKSGEIDYTVVDSDVARLNRSYYPTLDFSTELSFPQRSSWGVAIRNQWLADSINTWYEEYEPKGLNRLLLKRYFEISKRDPYATSSFTRNFAKGYISNFDDLFKKHAASINWDWKLLASMGFTESHFDSTVVSWAGARGIMQIMPRTAKAFGLDENKITINNDNIETATKIIKSLDNSLKNDVPDPQERLKFIIAAYNSGIAHVKDAISIAKAYGYNPAKWDGNVSEALKLKANPEVYNNSEICKFGYFKGTYTTSYVSNVMKLYEKARDAKI